DFADVAAELVAATARGGNGGRADAKIAFELMADERLDEPPPERFGSRAGGQVRSDFAHGASVLEILAHELLDGQQAGDCRIVFQSREAELIGALQHVFSLSVLEMQIVADPEQKIARGAKRFLL